MAKAHANLSSKDVQVTNASDKAKKAEVRMTICAVGGLWFFTSERDGSVSQSSVYEVTY